MDALLQHSLAFAQAWHQAAGGGIPANVLDLGSGGGVPGLVLAHLWDCPIVLLDGSVRRAAFLVEQVRLLGLAERVSVEVARAETAAHGPLRASRALVVARGFAAPSVTAECGGAFLRPGGVLAVSEPPRTEPERWSVGGLGALGLRLGPQIERPGRVQVLEWAGPFPERFPRRVGIPAKRPLWPAG